MKNTLFSAIVGTGLLLFPVCAVRSAPLSTDDNAWHQTRDQYFNGQTWRAYMFERIRTDLDHVQSLASGPANEDRVAKTKQLVTELQANLTAGKYDRAELDAAIGNLEKVVADDGLCARDRDMLADDLSRVRDYRASHENWR